jgi:hypothetical protein
MVSLTIKADPKGEYMIILFYGIVLDIIRRNYKGICERYNVLVLNVTITLCNLINVWTIGECEDIMNAVMNARTSVRWIVDSPHIS